MIQGSYNPESFESKWYKIWEENSSFLPKKGDKETFSIVIPPPNVTGSLHMGHALQHCIIDVIIRRKRMQNCSSGRWKEKRLIRYAYKYARKNNYRKS